MMFQAVALWILAGLLVFTVNINLVVDVETMWVYLKKVQNSLFLTLANADFFEVIRRKLVILYKYKNIKI